MAGLVSLSEGATIALHSMMVLGRNLNQYLNAKDISAEIEASTNHVSKILQRLHKQGWLTSLRGPKGGFQITDAAKNISLLDIVEAIDGKINPLECSLHQHVCPAHKCLVNNLLNTFELEVRNKLASIKLQEYI